MIESIHIDREGRLFRIAIDTHLESGKAADIAKLVQEDAGDAGVRIGKKKRLRRLTANGLVTPSTMRCILDVITA
jgi:hypothetical protein